MRDLHYCDMLHLRAVKPTKFSVTPRLLASQGVIIM